MIVTLAGCARDQNTNTNATENSATPILTAAASIAAESEPNSVPSTEWRHYLGDKASTQYSPLQQINTENVAQLEVAWRYDPDDAGAFDTLISTNPLIVKGLLYGLSARKNLFALNAATGEEMWVHRFNRTDLGKGAGRGLVYWEGVLAGEQQATWLLVGLGHQLHAIDALTGKPARAFADNGVLDLRAGLDRPVKGLVVNVVAPGTLFGDLLISGFGTSEFYGAAPGYIRAYHIPTGELRWTFRTIPAAGEFGDDTWPAENREQHGGANAWAGITVDEERGLAFVPTGSATFDYYGKNRAGDNLFANSLIALNAATGERVWHYQFVRHDLWDRDLPTPPNLVTLRRDGETLPAIAQATKSGHVFVFHRETGEPLFPIEEVPVLGEGLPGEHPPTSQPLPLAPPPFTAQTFQLTDISTQSADYVGALIEGMSTTGPYTTPSEAGTVVYPGLDGGAQWGGQAWDAESGLYFVNANEVPWFFRMVPTEVEAPNPESIKFAYTHYCGGCHGVDRRGNGDLFPDLTHIGEKYWPWEIWDIMRNGRGRMPAFQSTPWTHLIGPLIYLYTAGDAAAVSADPSESKAPAKVTEPTSGQTVANSSETFVDNKVPAGYMLDGFHLLTDEFGLPGSKPPWGSLTALNLSDGTIAWQRPLGDYPQALAKGLSGLGAENYGGPVVTAGDLLFIAASPDKIFRAFHKRTGELLWQDELPAAGFATPAVYAVDGVQYVVIAAGGGRLEQPSGSSYIAYALPKRGKIFCDKKQC